MFCKARKMPLPVQDNVTEKLEQLVRQVILEPVQPGGVTNASPVVSQRKRSGELRLCVDLKVHTNGKDMDAWMRTTQYQTWRRSSTTYMGPHTLAKLTSQMPTIKLNFTKKQKIYAQSTHLRDFKMCRLPQGLKNSSSIFQNCIESTLKGIKGVVIFQDDVLLYGTTKEQLDKRMLAVKSRLREKKFTTNEKKSNSKPVDSVSFLRYSISKKGIETDPKHVVKSFVGLADSYGRMVPDFATKMLPLNNMRNSDFSWGKMQQKAFEDIKNEFCANPLVQP